MLGNVTNIYELGSSSQVINISKGKNLTLNDHQSPPVTEWSILTSRHGRSCSMKLERTYMVTIRSWLDSLIFVLVSLVEGLLLFVNTTWTRGCKCKSLDLRATKAARSSMQQLELWSVAALICIRHWPPGQIAFLIYSNNRPIKASLQWMHFEWVLVDSGTNWRLNWQDFMIFHNFRDVTIYLIDK